MEVGRHRMPVTREMRTAMTALRLSAGGMLGLWPESQRPNTITVGVGARRPSRGRVR